MALLEINTLRKAASGSDYVSDHRICVSADGELVECTDPSAVRLLVGEGGSIPRAEAERYGLIADEPLADEPPAEPKARGPLADKARRDTGDKA